MADYFSTIGIIIKEATGSFKKEVYLMVNISKCWIWRRIFLQSLKVRLTINRPQNFSTN